MAVFAGHTAVTGGEKVTAGNERIMKIVSSADWRDGIPFDTPMRAADVAPGEATRCAGCGSASGMHERDQLWAVKHKHPNNPAGFVRFYCAQHVPAVKGKPADAEKKPRRTRASRATTARAPKPRAATAEERPQPVCPTCFVQISATGLCGICGERLS